MISLDLDSIAPETFDMSTNAHGGLGTLTANTAACLDGETEHDCEHHTEAGC